MLILHCESSFESPKHKWKYNISIITCNVLVRNAEFEFPDSTVRYVKFGAQLCDLTEYEPDLTYLQR
jgi:hypothetical protein